MTKARPKKQISKENKDAHHNTLDAGLNYLGIKSLGDTSGLGEQAKAFEQYVINQGIDPEKDLSGLPRHVKLYANMVPDAQAREKASLIETVTENFDYLLPQLPADILLQTAVQLGKTEAEKGLEKVLTESPDKIDEVRKAFGELYKPSSLMQSYIALNDNPTEVTQCAASALQRSYTRRAAEFQHLDKGKPVINKRQLQAYIPEQIKETEQEDANEAMLQIGSLLAMKKAMAEQEKAKKQTGKAKSQTN